MVTGSTSPPPARSGMRWSKQQCMPIALARRLPHPGLAVALSAFAPVVNAVIGFWATLSLNISDFTRFSRSQAAQFRGQFFGLPVFMAGFSVVSVIVTGCCAKVYGAGVSLDPASIASLAGAGHPAIVACSCVGLILATLSTNIAANVVAPANAFANAWPSRITFFRGALLTAAVGTAVTGTRCGGIATAPTCTASNIERATPVGRRTKAMGMVAEGRRLHKLSRALRGGSWPPS